MIYLLIEPQDIHYQIYYRKGVQIPYLTCKYGIFRSVCRSANLKPPKTAVLAIIQYPILCRASINYFHT